MNIDKSIDNNFKTVNLNKWKDLVASSLKKEDISRYILFNSLEGIEHDALNISSDQFFNLRSFPDKMNISFTVHDKDEENVIRDICEKLDVKSFYYQSSDINSSKIHNKGASGVLELVYIIDSFMKLVESKKEITIEVSIDSVTYFNIAKLRALRFMLETIVDENKLSNTFKIIATSSLREQTIFDPWNNMLRNTSSFTSALVGGANEYALTSFDYAFTLANKKRSQRLGIRNSVNMANILIDESKLNFVTDPARGSYTIENLTSKIIEEVKKLLIENESKPLDYKSLIKKNLEKRKEAVNKRDYIIAGINDYANPYEDLISIYKTDSISLNIDSIYRLSEEFEKLRFELSVKQIKVPIIVYPNLKKTAARLNFCKNLFELGGIEACEKTVDDEIGGDFLCLCAPDELLNELIEKVDTSKYKKVFIPSKKVKLKDAINIFQGVDVFKVLNNFKENK